ncbi:MAG TPA: ABC transporter substrate-binding protein, partial [Steroidobacteraceae bacterium]|nr:ABC transporter substrate-binding protein [Steroidobacteraceae bacterium]
MRRRVRQKNSRALLTLVSLLFSLLGGCSDGTGDYGAKRRPPLVLGFSQIVAEANWNTANTESIRKAARDAGIDLRLEDANRSQEKQVAQLRSFVSQRVDVIAFSPVVENGWVAVLREIRAAGIPVILMDRTIEVSDDSLYVSLIGSDFVEEGRRAGRWLIEHTRDVPGEIDIVELQGTVGSAPANDRKQGFAEVISADRRYRIIRSQSGDFDRALAREVMAEFLNAEGRRIRVLFSHSDTMALGAIEAIEDAGLKPGSDILVISIEGSRKGLEAILAGKLNVTVECSPLLGPQLMTAVKELAAGKPVPRRVITLESVFTRENAAMELPHRAY